MEPCGYYLDCDDAICRYCATPEGIALALGLVYSWDESDAPVHCVRCGDLLDCGLTEDGRLYVAEHLAYNSAGPAVVQWSDRWPELAPVL